MATKISSSAGDSNVFDISSAERVCHTDECNSNLHIKDENIELPLSQNTMNILTEDLDFEGLDRVLLSQGASQKTVGEVNSTLNISCFNQNKVVKNTPWIYSESLQRLFLKPMESVPIVFHCGGTFNSNMCIVVTVRFEEAQFAAMTVRVCPNHTKSNTSNLITHPNHMIQYCGERVVNYLEPPSSDHYAVRIPVLGEAFGSGQTECFRMSCSSSCMMIGRRKIILSAELIYEGQILSSVSVPIKISSSPLRDKQKEESKLFTGISEAPGTSPHCKKAKTDDSKSTHAQSTEMLVRLKGRKNCEELKNWLAKNVSPNHYAFYHQSI